MSPATLNIPKILLIKTSSLGDVLHNLPVVGDILGHYPEAKIDWLVEESFAALPGLHPKVRKVIPVALRRWRGQLLNASTWEEISKLRSTLSTSTYDFVIDTQGLLKSALLTRLSKGIRCGFDRHSAREPLAASLYQRTFQVAKAQHAVERCRQLAAQALGYSLDQPAAYGIIPPTIAHPAWLPRLNYAVLLHATSREHKLWDEANWIALGHYFRDRNIISILPWGNRAEQARSQRLSAAIPDALIPPRLNLTEAAGLLGGAKAIIGVDTGLAHLAAALGNPTIGLYTTTNPALTGLYAGNCAVNLGNIGQPPTVNMVCDCLQKLC